MRLHFLYVGEDTASACGKAARVTASFFEQLPDVQEMLLKDVQAGFDGDPAAKSREEIIFSYPGFLAIYVYRLAISFIWRRCLLFPES